MLIRRAMPEDVDVIHRTHVASIKSLCACAYTPGQIESWTQALSREAYIRGMDSLEFCVAGENGGEVSGLLIYDLEKGEVCALYVAPGAAGTGVGGKLLAYAENEILARGHAKVFLKSTLNAVSFYEHMGFVRGEESVHPLRGGEGLRCVEMTKRLA